MKKFNIMTTFFTRAGRSSVKRRILRALERIEMNQTEMLERLNALDASMAVIGDEVTKIGTETTALLAEVAALKDAIANAGNTTPEVDAALAAVEARAGTLAASVQGVDDLVPDVPAVP